jgi:hypothetical protein
LRPADAPSTSWLYPAASIGGTLGPGAIGLVVVGFGVGWTPIILPVVAAAMTIAFGAANRMATQTGMAGAI